MKHSALELNSLGKSLTNALIARETTLPWFLTQPQSSSCYVDPDVPYLVLDFETTNLDKGSALNEDNHIVLACWTLVTPNGETSHYRRGDEYQQQALLGDIGWVLGKGGFIVAHYAKFELQWLKRCGVDLRDVLVYDTFLGQWVLDGNRSTGERSLDSLGHLYGVGQKESVVAKLIDAGVCPSKITPSWLLEYCLRDVALTLDVFKRQREELAKANQLHLALARNLTCCVLADIEFNGLYLDHEEVEKEYNRVLEEHTVLKYKLAEMTGGLNMASPKQLGEFLFDKLGFSVPTDHRGNKLLTASGQPSTNAEALSKLVATTAEQREFLDSYKKFNKADSLLSKVLVFFKKVVEERGGKFYFQLNQGRTGTHRLASNGISILFEGEKKARGVQGQNLPREYKRLFVAPYEGGYVVGEGDGAQLEFRVAVDMGNDPVGREEIANDVDVHAITRDVITENGQPINRQEAKSRTFKPLYGGKSGTPAEVAYIEFFNKKYAGIAEEQERWKIKVLNEKKLTTPYGLTFYWPDTIMKRGGYITNSTSISNYPVQGFATGEIIPIALVFFWHRLRGMKSKVFTTIHDSIGTYVALDEVEEYKQLTKQALTLDVFSFLASHYNYEFKTPLGVGIKIGDHWGVGKEMIWNVFPNGHETYKEK